MNGAESLLKTAAAAGINVCFANPGTTEMPLVAALDTVPGVRAILGLFEGVCTGAADGYARMAGRPALTLLHLGPGLANGLANLHNARRASSPVVNVIGDQATWHHDFDAPLTSDIVSLAKPVSGWVCECKSAGSLASDMADAVTAAFMPPGQVSTLIVPSDCQWEETETSAPAPALHRRQQVSDKTVEQIAQLIRGGQAVALMVGGQGLTANGLRSAARVAAGSSCRLMS